MPLWTPAILAHTTRMNPATTRPTKVVRSTAAASTAWRGGCSWGVSAPTGRRSTRPSAAADAAVRVGCSQRGWGCPSGKARGSSAWQRPWPGCGSSTPSLWRAPYVSWSIAGTTSPGEEVAAGSGSSFVGAGPYPALFPLQRGSFLGGTEAPKCLCM
jgi:hypothetical protein